MVAGAVVVAGGWTLLFSEPGRAADSGLNASLTVPAAPAVSEPSPTPTPEPPAAGGCTGGSLVVVAHTDDDLLFINPTQQRDISAGTCVHTVYLTAGDAGRSAKYWQNRESGVVAAYADMAGVSTEAVEGSISSRHLRMLTLKGNTSVNLIFMRLPDGMPRGSGAKSNKRASLRKLWAGTIPTVTTVDDAHTYTKAELIETLTELMRVTGAETVRTMDFVGTFKDSDHTDHHATGYLTKAASAQYLAPHKLIAYQGYGVARKKANVSKADAKVKLKTFNIYAQHDTVRQNRNYVTREYVLYESP